MQHESRRNADQRVLHGLRVQVTSFLASMQLLTLVPPVIRRPFELRELGGAVGYFPAVGLLLGLILTGIDAALGVLFPEEIEVILLLGSWVVMTGALHLDGFLDTCDGLFGGHTPEARLRILRDEHMGAFALAGGVLLLLLKCATLGAITHRVRVLLVAPTLGRWGMSLAVVTFPYARPKGMGRALKDNAGWREAALATGIGLVVAWLAAGWQGLAALGLSGLTVWAGARFAIRRIPGLTGDIYGALCEVIEVVVLLAFVALEGWIA